MKALRELWGRLNDRYVALSRRERMLLAATFVLAPLLIGEALLLDPQRKRSLAKENSITQQSAAMAALQSQLAALQQQLLVDPDAAAKAEIAALQAEQGRQDEELKTLGTTLVSPQEMNGLLERLLVRHSGLRLLSLKTLKPESVLARTGGAGEAAPAKAASSSQRFDLYRHGVEIRLEGNFADLHAYLVQLERSPQRLLWGTLHYEVGDYPKAEMSLTVYTLSADRSWLAL